MERPIDRRPVRFAMTASLLALLVAATVLVGWALDIAAIKSVLPGLATMKANTALGILGVAAALGLRAEVGSGRYAGRVLAASAALLGSATLIEYNSDLDFGLDQYLFRDRETASDNFPGRMAPMTAFSLVLLGTALLLLDAPGLAGDGSQPLAFVGALVNVVALIGYLYGTDALYRVGPFSTVAVHTAASFLLVALGILASRPRQGLMGLLATRSLGGLVVRRQLCAALAFLLLFGWVRIAGERSGMFPGPFGTALMIALSIACFALLIGATGRHLHDIDVKRRAAEDAVEDQRRFLQATLVGIGDAVIATDAAGRVTFLNPVAVALTGWTEAEAAGTLLESVFLIVNETSRRPVENPLLRALEKRMNVGLANHTVLISKSGVEYPIEDSASPIREADGSVVGVVLVFRDVTERRRQERELEEREKQLRTASTRLESTLSVGEIGTWEYDARRDIVRADRNLARIYGMPSEEAVEGPVQPYVDIIHPDDRERVLAAVGRAMESGERYEAEYRLILPDKSIRWVMARARIERRSSGGELLMPGVVMDITNRKVAEERLARSEEDRRLALDSAELGSWHIDPAAGTMRTDERFQRIFSGAVQPIGYEEAFGFIHHDDRDGVRAAVAAATRSDDPAPYAEEYRVVHRDGSVHWVLGKGRANFEGAEPRRRLASFDGTIADITRRRRMEDDLRQLAAELSESDRRKDEFIATLAHELRNPLAPIRSGLEIIRLSGSSGPIEKARTMMDRQLTQMVRLVDDLLDASRITQGKMELRRERVDVRAVVENAVETSRPIVEQAGHDLRVALPDGPVPVEGDMTRLAQVVSNLLNNSAKYMRRGGEIRLTVARESGSVVLSVADDGIGIPPAMLGNIFTMFTQVDRSLEKITGGLGIGLSLVKGFVEMHGGTVEAKSAGEGLGSEFVVRLPASPDQRVSSYSENGPAEGVTALGRRRILVVDDNVDGAESLGQLLEMLGHEVRTVHDGEAGVLATASYRPDMVLMDIGMPKLNGYEAARLIRTSPEGGRVMLVALTGWGQEDDRARSAEAGFDAHLVKPVEFAALARLLSVPRKT